MYILGILTLLSVLILVLPIANAYHTIDHDEGLPIGIDELRKAVDYCYMHADDPNAVQTLVDAGLLSEYARGHTCADLDDELSTKEIFNRFTKNLID